MRREAQFLRNEGKSETMRMLRPLHPHLGTVDRDRAAVGQIQTHKQLDERTLTGTVLAADRPNLTSRDVERYATQGLHRAETLCQ